MKNWKEEQNSGMEKDVFLATLHVLKAVKLVGISPLEIRPFSSVICYVYGLR